MLPSNPGKLILLMGPSGVGKSTILQYLREHYPAIHFPKSATTRPRREGEGDELYHFVDDEAFDHMIEENQLLEYAVVHGGARYGTLVEEIIPPIESGKTVVREVDVQGFESIRNHKFFRGTHAPYALESVFILPENKEQLIERIVKRAPISEEELSYRIASMEKELTYAEQCTHTVVNKNNALDNTMRTIESLITS